MSDTWRENAIVEAIQIIADKKIAEASFDKTIKAVINRVLDETVGKYQIKYQDSLFQAYATSSKLSYQKDQMVSVLIPGNDWNRVKTILGGVENKVVTYNSIPVASNQYNAIGIGGTNLTQQIGLSSYKKYGDIYLFKNGQNGFFINTESYKYIKKGNSIALRMDIRTDLASSQVGGNYGVIFRLVFKDNVTGQQTIRNFTVQKRHVIGQPYSLRAITPVEVLYTDVDTYNFQRIDSIQAFCQGFPQDDTKTDIKDIFISGIYINGADALTEDALNGYSLHIVDPQGTQITEDLNIIKLVAQLKQSGRIVTNNVQYFWGIQDGTVFRGSAGSYSGYLGDGWKCLNYYDANLRAFIPFNSPEFYFTSQKRSDDIKRNIALAESRQNNVKCVAVLSGNTFSGQIQVINTLLGQVKIISSDKTDDNKNKTIYYLDNGNPDLTCQLYDRDNNKITDNLTYQWSIFPSIGRGQIVKDTQTIENEIDEEDYYKKWENEWQIIKDKYSRISGNQQEDYMTTEQYINAKDNFDKVQYEPYIHKEKYYNFPIKSISGSMKVSCAVYQDNVYKGTGSITLYNKNVLEGMYSLNIENGTQVFQYDTKGNSPASKQLDKPLIIQPLNFTLIDNQGKIVTHEQIRQDGWIKWIIPNTQTLLSSLNDEPYDNGETDITVIRADLPLAANRWDVYKNLDQFTFAIDDRYDSKKNINYIWLNVKYKDLILDAYTNFSFPKDGDPGTNGTDFIAKITSDKTTDWIYISNQAPSQMFGDDGSDIDELKFQLYNNSRKISDEAHYWICPPATRTNNNTDLRINLNTYLQSGSGWQKPQMQWSCINKTIDNIQSDKPVNIIRGQYGTGGNSGDPKYFSEVPICTQFVESGNYKIKIKPKTGFKYVVYSEDGTRPDYDNTLPFDIILQKNESDFFIKDTTHHDYTWIIIGNLEFDERQNQLNNIEIDTDGITSSSKVYIKPKDNFTGQDLSSAIIVKIDNIGFIHIPIYMILNRYGHAALNGWDGNSIQLNGEGNTILAPQIGAGHKQDDNSYTGVFMGSIRGLEEPESGSDAISKGLDVDNNKVGFMGYNHGQRTIFLDAKTGKAEFGKNNAGRIILDPSSTFMDTENNEKPLALLYSGNYPIADFRNTEKGNFDVVKTGNLKDNKGKNDKGLLIDLSTPQIGFGSGSFTVNSKGHLVAKGGGEIAGWSITNTKLHQNNRVGMASSDQKIPSDIGLKNNNFTEVITRINDNGTTYTQQVGDSVAFWAGGTYSQQEEGLSDANFYTTHGGFLYSKLGRIASWNIDKDKLQHINKKIGMGTGPKKIFHYFNSNSVASTVEVESPRFWAINENKQFIVDNNGKFWANEGQIGPWTIDQSKLTNGNTGLGSNVITKDHMNSAFNEGTIPDNQEEGVQARIWALSDSDGDNSKVNFVVTNDGKLYSKAGKIGGWNIEQNKLWSVNSENGEGIRINANGSMSGGSGNGNNGGWAINRDGTSSFYGITAHTGTIGGATIYETNEGSGISTGNWNITSGGLAQFSKIKITDGVIQLGNTTITGSNFSGSFGIGNNSFRSGGFSTTGGGSGATSSINSGITGTTNNGYGDTDTLQDFGERAATHRAALWNVVGAKSVYAGVFNAKVSTTDPQLTIGQKYVTLNSQGVWIHHGDLRVDSNVGIVFNGLTGKTGTIYFSDGSNIRVEKGMIVSVQPGSEASWR